MLNRVISLHKKDLVLQESVCDALSKPWLVVVLARVCGVEMFTLVCETLKRPHV